MDITNNEQLNLAINNIVKSFVDMTTKEIMDMLYQRIDLDTYGGKYNTVTNMNYANGTGKPTYEFRNSWEWNKISDSANLYLQELFCNSVNMSFDGEIYGIHSSIHREDIREQLASFLNVNGTTSSIGVKSRKPYWDNFINELDKKIDRISLKNLKKLGKEFGFIVM